MEEATDRELMVAAYQLSVQIAKLQNQLNVVQAEIDKRVKEELSKPKEDGAS